MEEPNTVSREMSLEEVVNGLPEFHRAREEYRRLTATDEAEQQVSPPLMVIENRPKLGVSAKYEMPALTALSRTEFETFVTRVCGSVSQIAAARAAGSSAMLGRRSER